MDATPTNEPKFDTAENQSSPACVEIKENGEKMKANTPKVTEATETLHSNFDEQRSEDSLIEEKKILITICNGDRKKKKAFMSIPSRKNVIEKANIYGLTGTTLVLESNGCEICEDEVLIVFAKEKCLLMLLDDNEDYVPLPQPISVALKRDKNVNCSSDQVYYADNSIVFNNNDSTLSNDETLSMTSITPSGSTTVKTFPQFDDFILPWKKIPDHIMKLLREKSSLGKRINTLANILVDELRERSTHIPMSVLRQVAQQAAEKYPDSLLEKDREGQLIATTPQSLISKMVNRNNSLNRNMKRSNFSPNFNVENLNGSKKRKFNIMDSSNGKMNEILRDSLEIKKNILINYHNNNKPVEPETLFSYMKQCYPLQREFFNNKDKVPDISTIKENWPYIFEKDVLYEHFKMLMGKDPRNFVRNFMSEKQRIFKYFKNSKNKKLNTLEENDANVIRGLAYHFNEEPDFIFKYFDHNTNEEILRNANPTNAPWVALIRGNSEPAKSESDFVASIFIEGKIMVNCRSEVSCFADILAQLLCYYYTFNMMYPTEVTQTLDFIDIYFLKHSPEQLRNAKKIATGNSKFNQLISKFAN